MSRIHEALKKAEQERAAIQGGGEQPGFNTTPVDDPDVLEEMPARAGAAAAVSYPSVAGFPTSVSVDTLLARAAQLEWKPDMATMLFLQSDDSARGTEEFRTLRSRLSQLREKMPLKTLLVT